MADMFSKEKRSEIMSKIRSSDTKIEVIVRKWLFANGFRYRKNDRRLPGAPDIVLPKYKTVIFVNGCFWHAHEGCRYSRIPKSNVDYWKKKIERNVENDRRNHEAIGKLGWNVIVVWECELKKKDCTDYLENLVANIRQGAQKKDEG